MELTRRSDHVGVGSESVSECGRLGGSAGCALHDPPNWHRALKEYVLLGVDGRSQRCDAPPVENR